MSSELLAQATDPILGTWELNLAKSKIASEPPPKSSTVTFVQDGDAFKFTSRGIGADGKPILEQFTARYDGQDYPVTGNPARDTISCKRIDKFNCEVTVKKAGKVTWTTSRVISADGKSYTLTSRSTNAKGETVTDVTVYDKR